MRERKFRAWDSFNECYYYSDEEKFPNLAAFFIHVKFCEDGGNGIVLEQFTGLKDKNGVEIYEWDIVNFHVFTQELGLNMGVQEGEKEFKGFICFEELGLAFKESEEDEEWFYLVYSPGMIHEESFEVIGNIHSNSELLK